MIYTFHTIPRNPGHYSSWTHYIPQAWHGKKVRLYIDRNNPSQYYLDDVPIPDEQSSTVENPAVPSSTMTQYKRRAWTKTLVIAVILIVVLILLWIIPAIL